jgi:hypothetical protein
MTRWLAFKLYWLDVLANASLRANEWAFRRAEEIDPNRRTPVLGHRILGVDKADGEDRTVTFKRAPKP